LDAVQQEVKRIVSVITKASEEKLGLDTDLKAELNVDSLQGLQIVAALEKRFGVSIPDEELDSYTSIRAISDVVRKHGTVELPRQ